MNQAHNKAKYGLVLIHVTLAILLLWQGELWQRRTEARIHGMVGPSPHFLIVAALNAPVMIVRRLTFYYLPGIWDDVVLVIAVALFWYWFGLNAESWRKRRTVMGFHRVPLRVTSDLALIVGGILMVVAAVGDFSHAVSAQLAYVLPLTVLWLTWSAVFILTFGRDLVLCVAAHVGTETAATHRESASSE